MRSDRPGCAAALSRPARPRRRPTPSRRARPPERSRGPRGGPRPRHPEPEVPFHSPRGARVRITRTTAGVAAATLLALSLAACGGSDDDAASAAPSGDVGSTDLAAAGCPDTVVIQTDWNPESEHGGAYQLIGDDHVVDAGSKSVSGTLVDGNGDSTGVKVEV